MARFIQQKALMTGTGESKTGKLKNVLLIFELTRNNSNFVPHLIYNV